MPQYRVDCIRGFSSSGMHKFHVNSHMEVNRDFRAATPTLEWLTDVTDLQIPACKIYLSPIFDCFDWMVESRIIETSPDAELVNTISDSAIETGGINRPARLMFRPSRP